MHEKVIFIRSNTLHKVAYRTDCQGNTGGSHARFACIILSVFTVLVLLFSEPAAAQIDSSIVVQSIYEGIIIDSIIIDNRNIYDTDSSTYDKFIFKLANKFHFKTTRNTIKRELLFQKGDTYSEELVEETARILRQQFVLYDVWIEKEQLPNGNLLIRIVTIDQWSLSAGVHVKREGNENRVKIGALEKNLFGLNQFLSFHYIDQTEDDNYIEAAYADYRILGYPLNGKILYSNNPTDGFTQYYLLRPYYNLDQSFSFMLSAVLSRNGRRDVYQDDQILAQSRYEGDWYETGFSYRIGSYRKKLTTHLAYKYNHETSFDKQQYSSTSQLETDGYFPDDSLTNTVTSAIKYSDSYFTKMKNIDGFNYTEDFELGTIFQIDFQQIYGSHFSQLLYNTISVSCAKNLFYKNNLFLLSFYRKYWYHDNQELRNQNQFAVKYYNTSFTGMTIAVQGKYLSDLKPNSYDLLLLGGTSGLRGYDKYFKTGDSKIVINNELRFHPKVSILSALFGMTFFADIAQIRDRTEHFKLDNFYTSLGAGLRIAFDRSTKNIIRVDLAFSKENDWTFSIGSGYSN